MDLEAPWVAYPGVALRSVPSFDEDVMFANTFLRAMKANSVSDYAAVFVTKKNDLYG
jgi:hypothetical protein